jgi:hypothetical protein
MKNVISIHRKKFLGAYTYAQGRGRIPDAASFFTGVFSSVVLPEIICCAYSGLAGLILFAGIALTGSLVGLAMYQSPHQTLSCVRTDTMPQAPSSNSVGLKRAA